MGVAQLVLTMGELAISSKFAAAHFLIESAFDSLIVAVGLVIE
jgi:hypothetical protein